MHFRHAEAAADGRDAQIAAGGDFEAGTEAKAVDTRDNGNRQLAQGLAHLVQPGDECSGRSAVQRHHLVDVGATYPGLVSGATQDDGPGGVLVKLKKPDQERRADLPTVGAGTIEAAAEAGLRGIAVEAGETLMFDRAELIAAADRLGVAMILTGVRHFRH